MEFQKDEAKIISQKDDRYIGIRDFDQKIYEYFIYNYGIKYKKFRTNSITKIKLFNAIEKLRRELCEKEEATIILENLKPAGQNEQIITRYI